MGNDNYHESMENHRQELSGERMADLSRRARQAPKSNSRGLLLPSLFFIFILIPATLLIYVAFYYEPDDTLTAKTNGNEVSFELNSQPPSTGTVLAATDDSNEQRETLKQQEAKEQKEMKERAREREALAAKEKEQQEAKKQQEQKAKETALAEEKAKEAARAEQQAQEEAEAKAQAKQQAEAEKKQQAEAEKKQEEQSEVPLAGGKTIVVQSSETLYRIAVNNYGASGAAAAVEKIKQANGLASNNISPGQTLVLP